MGQNKRITFEVSSEWHRWLKLYAAERNTSMSAILRGWLDESICPASQQQSESGGEEFHQLVGGTPQEQQAIAQFEKLESRE